MFQCEVTDRTTLRHRTRTLASQNRALGTAGGADDPGPNNGSNPQVNTSCISSFGAAVSVEVAVAVTPLEQNLQNLFSCV